MNLLMITGDRSLAQGKRGAFYYTLEEFRKHWDRIDIICPKVSNFGFRASDFSNKVRVYPSPWPLIFQPLWIRKKGKELFNAQKFDLVTAHEYAPFYNGIGAYFLHNKTKAPYLLEVMHIPGYPKASNLKEFVYRWLSRMFIDDDARYAKAVRVINTKETPDFLEKAGIPREKLLYIPAMYIDLEVFRPQEVKKEYDLIYVGRLAENKGIDLFINAAQKINAKAVIVGDGPLKKKLVTSHSSLATNITFHGWANDAQEISSLINKSRILVMPSHNEGGPRVVLEALACGVPVLATPVGAVPDLADKGAVQVVKWDLDDIAKKAELLLRDVPRYVEMRRKGIEVAKQFERKAAIKNYADSLKKILATSH